MDSIKPTGKNTRPQPSAKTSIGPAPLSTTKRNKKLPIKLIFGVVLVLLIGFVMLGIINSMNSPRADRYQMVYMDDGKVYFGKLKNTKGDYLRLENAYSVRSSGQGAGASAPTPENASNVSLLKISDLVYGPESDMMLRAENVNFWQDLKKDSKVTKAIQAAEK